tara:strand:- start:511 stop:807 length:297 start_codon:yes stop_codon:yes gene_type:complete
MTIDQIKSFCSISVCGSFTIAAHKLFRSQPAISNQIKLLEEELGEKLFIRVRPKFHEGGIILTSAGETFLPYAQQILELQEEARRMVRGNGDEQLNSV